MKYFVVLLFFTIHAVAFDYHLKPYKINDNVDCFFGLSSIANKTNGGNIINSCYITTNEGFVVIDSGPSYSYAQQAFQAMQKKQRLPVTHVINTSTNEMHLLGNEFYKERGAILIGSKDYDKDAKIKLSTATIGSAFSNTRLIELDRRVDGDYNLTVGGVDISIRKAIKDSNKHLIIDIPSRDILFVGDILSHNSIPILNSERSLLAWIDTIKKIENDPWSRIISTNGIRIKRSAINSTKSYLNILKKELTKNIKNRVNRADSIKNIKISKFKEERLYEEWHEKNIALAYTELAKIIKPNPIPTPMVSLPISNQEKKTSKKVIKKKEVKVEKPKVKKAKLEKAKVKKPQIKKPEVKKAEVKKPKIKKKKKAKVQPITTYYSYDTAKYYAKQEKKVILLKVRSNHCPFCDELDSVMQRSHSIRKIVNKNFKMIYVNVSMGKLPLGIQVKKIPSLVLIRPDREEVVMTITNFKSVGELLNMLKVGVKKGKAGGYLK